MAKGRLRCIGTTVRLKSRFGAGYKVSVSLQAKNDSAARAELLRIFASRFSECDADDGGGSYIHFSVRKAADSEMAGLFLELESRRAELGLADIQISMSTLEDVFLRIVKRTEVEEARKTNKTTNVTLPDGQTVAVALGSEDEIVSSEGARFRAKWGTDESGNLTCVGTVMLQAVESQPPVNVPDADALLTLDGRDTDATDSLSVTKGAADGYGDVKKAAGNVLPMGIPVAEAVPVSRERIDRLEASFWKQVTNIYCMLRVRVV
jgi:hypothetical protein